MKKNGMKISRRERKIILKHLNQIEEFDRKYPLPEKYYCINGVTMIGYGYMQRKCISVAKIEVIAKEIGAKYW